MNILYNIAIKTTTGMNDDLFEKTINQDRLKTIKLKDINNWEELANRYKLTHVLVPRGDFNQIIKIFQK